MKANTKGKIPVPSNVEQAVATIQAIQRKKTQYDIPRAVILGTMGCYEFLYANYVQKIDNANSEEEKQEQINLLLEKLRVENKHTEELKEKMEKEEI